MKIPKQSSKSFSMKKTTILLYFILGALSNQSYGQNSSNNQENRAHLLAQIGETISANYIFLDVALRTDSILNLEESINRFSHLTNVEFADNLTNYLREITDDKHFFVKYLTPDNSIKIDLSEKEQLKEMNLLNSYENFGFEEVKRLNGNIGYINFKGFADPKASENTLAAAMNFVANTNALIIDLRQNKGGDGGMLMQFCSYFFKHKIKLCETYYRNTNKNIQNWTEKKVIGTKYLNKPVYILTSHSSFSAAEGLAYFLQAYGIATIVGEKTGGAANPVDQFLIDNTYLLFVPNGKTTATLTKNNWEHIGVLPNQIIQKEKAFTAAYIMALNDLIKKSTPSEMTDKAIQELIYTLEKDL